MSADHKVYIVSVFFCKSWSSFSSSFSAGSCSNWLLQLYQSSRLWLGVLWFVLTRDWLVLFENLLMLHQRGTCSQHILCLVLTICASYRVPNLCHNSSQYLLMIMAIMWLMYLVAWFGYRQRHWVCYNIDLWVYYIWWQTKIQNKKKTLRFKQILVNA